LIYPGNRLISHPQPEMHPIKSLSKEDYNNLIQWFLVRDWEQWDSQFEGDVNTGKLDFLIEEARSEKAQHQLREL